MKPANALLNNKNADNVVNGGEIKNPYAAMVSSKRSIHSHGLVSVEYTETKNKNQANNTDWKQKLDDHFFDPLHHTIEVEVD